MNELCRLYQESYGTGPIREELAAHAKACEFCQTFSRQQDSLQQVLLEWKTPIFSEDFALSVMGRLAEDRVKKPGLWETVREIFSHRFSVPVPVGALASILLIVSLGLNFFFWTQSPNQIQTLNPGLAVGPTDVPTPMANAILSKQMITYPSNWTGTGAFLLIPMVDLNRSIILQGLTETKSDKEEI